MVSADNVARAPDAPGAAPAEGPYRDKHDPWSSHSRIAAWLAALAPGARVLDIGAATGTLGRRLAGRGLKLTGVEPHPEWARLAAPFYTVVLRGTLDEIDDPALAGFDAVVLADVLEHMAQPEAALRRLTALQPDGCAFVISVPNVANIWVRMQLLLGRFDYAERGILDRTHLRFFTRRSFTELLASAGLRLDALQVTPIPLGLVHPWFERSAAGRIVHATFAGLTSRLPTLLGYQFVARATRQVR